MDVDLSSTENDPITSELLQKFSCLNTNDREVLITQFKLLLGEKCSDSTAEFWLDMNNWNLQTAVCSYFDNESSTSNLLLKLPSVQITIPEQNLNEYPPNSPFTYYCTIFNSGDETWPQGCSLRFCGGQEMSKEERWLLPQLTPRASWTLNLQLITPEKAGLYCSQWRFSTITGQFFGETIFVIVNVLDDLSQVTKQLSSAHIVDHSPQQQFLSSSTLVPGGVSPSTDPSGNPDNNDVLLAQQGLPRLATFPMLMNNGSHDNNFNNDLMNSDVVFDNQNHHHPQQQFKSHHHHVNTSNANSANHEENSSGSSSYPEADDSSMTI